MGIPGLTRMLSHGTQDSQSSYSEYTEKHYLLVDASGFTQEGADLTILELIVSEWEKTRRLQYIFLVYDVGRELYELPYLLAEGRRSMDTLYTATKVPVDKGFVPHMLQNQPALRVLLSRFPRENFIRNMPSKRADSLIVEKAEEMANAGDLIIVTGDASIIYDCLHLSGKTKHNVSIIDMNATTGYIMPIGPMRNMLDKGAPTHSLWLTCQLPGEDLLNLTFPTDGYLRAKKDTLMRFRSAQARHRKLVVTIVDSTFEPQNSTLSAILYGITQGTVFSNFPPYLVKDYLANPCLDEMNLADFAYPEISDGFAFYNWEMPKMLYFTLTINATIYKGLATLEFLANYDQDCLAKESLRNLADITLVDLILPGTIDKRDKVIQSLRIENIISTVINFADNKTSKEYDELLVDMAETEASDQQADYIGALKDMLISMVLSLSKNMGVKSQIIWDQVSAFAIEQSKSSTAGTSALSIE